LFFYRNKPPTPPSPAADVSIRVKASEKEESNSFGKSLKALCKNYNYHLINGFFLF